MLKNQTARLIIMAMIVSPLAVLAQRRGQANAPSDIELYFSPKGGCTEAAVREINAAKRTIAIQAYSFTSTAIAQAVAKAKDRGVQVVAVLDKSNKGDQYSAATYLADHGIRTYIDSKHTIAHNKIIVIDGQTVIGGSFNYTKQAEDSNAENLMVMHRPDLAAQYQDNISEHVKHSEPYTR